MSAPRARRKEFETALAEYFSELEAGRRIGEQVLVTRYPQCAAELRKFFDDLSFVDAAMAACDHSDSAGTTTVHLSTNHDRRRVGTVASSRDFCETITWLGGFQIEEELGSGGQGVVYKARQAGTNRPVALKVLREGLFASRRDRQRFQTEIELSSRLQHPGIVTVYECGRECGRDFYAMEYVDGDPLDVYLSKRSLDVPATLALFLHIADAVSYAHQHGVIHRDLKPSNVLVDRLGAVHVLDFGLAKAIALSTDSDSTVVSEMTRAGDFAGTWHYASPEQVKRHPHRVDVRTDVYALGLLLYEMLTDCLPYPVREESKEAIAHHVLNTEPPRPSTIRREIDDDLDTIILTALQKDPDRRYASAAALVEDLRRYLAGDVIEAKRDSPWYVLAKTIRRYRWRFTAGAATLAALVIFAITISILYSRALAAQATTQLRTRIVRESQNYLGDKLGELNWATNRLAEIAAAHPQLREVQALTKEPCRDLGPFLALIAEDPPATIFEAVLNPISSGYGVARQWLIGHDAALQNLEAVLRSKRLDFGVESSSGSDLAIDQRPRFVLESQRLSEVFSAQALLKARAGQPRAAVASLDAARAIGVALGDSRMLHHKVSGVTARSRTYDAFSAILSGCPLEKAAVGAYAAWIQRDPPLPAYRLAMPTERQRISQLIEGACFAKRTPDVGYVDTEYLAAMVGGFLGGSSAAQEAFYDARGGVTPEEALALVNAYIAEVEQWDGLDLPMLLQRSRAIEERLEGRSAWPVVRMVLPGCKVSLQLRGRTQAKRAAQFLAADVLRYRLATGRWPETLADAVFDDAHNSIYDPYIARPFGYRVVQGTPVLYSLNEDAHDDQGKPGPWGMTKRDVILFQRGRTPPTAIPQQAGSHP